MAGRSTAGKAVSDRDPSGTPSHCPPAGSLELGAHVDHCPPGDGGGMLTRQAASNHGEVLPRGASANSYSGGHRNETTP
jgi:hypothetical protein